MTLFSSAVHDITLNGWEILALLGCGCVPIAHRLIADLGHAAGALIDATVVLILKGTRKEARAAAVTRLKRRHA